MGACGRGGLSAAVRLLSGGAVLGGGGGGRSGAGSLRRRSIRRRRSLRGLWDSGAAAELVGVPRAVLGISVRLAFGESEGCYLWSWCRGGLTGPFCEPLEVRQSQDGVLCPARGTHLLTLLRVGERHGARAADLGVAGGEDAATVLLKMSLICCMCDTRGGVFVSTVRRLVVVCRRRPIFAGEPATTADHNLLEGRWWSRWFCFVLRGDSLLNLGYWAIATSDGPQRLALMPLIFGHAC